jgi:hypothetical protein
MEIRKIVFLAFSLFFFACGDNEPPIDKLPEKKKPEQKKLSAPIFNPDTCYAYIKAQVDFGYRIPKTAAHEKCVNYLVNQLKKMGLAVQIQNGTATDFENEPLPIKNIIASYKPNEQKRILLCAHYDTRPFADRDTDANKKKPIDGAIDGASGVAVILELAREFAIAKPSIGIDIIFFDAEDYGDKYCLGSMYWSQNMHLPNYYAQYAILLDMVGAKNAKFPLEGNSKYYAGDIQKKIWNKAAEIGYSDYFIFDEVQAITDDHVYLNSIAHIPSVDIIQMNPQTKDFGDYHHKLTDNISMVDKNTLKAVGQTLSDIIYSE